MAEYELYLYTAQNVLSDVLTNFVSLEYTLVANEIGALSLELPGKYTNELGEDSRIEVYRDGVRVGNTQFLVIQDGFNLARSGEFFTRIEAATAMVVLKWPIVNYPTGSWPSHQSGYAGNIIKQMARQNLGTLASDTARDMSELLSVQADANDGAVMEIDAGWRRLLDVAKEVAGNSAKNGIDLYFDVVKNGSGLLELQTYTGQRGTDRSTTVLLSPERSTLSATTLRRDYGTAANRVIVAGAGQEIWRVVSEVSNSGQVNSTPWGYIKEHFYACTAETYERAITAGESYIRLNTNKVTLTGTPVDVPGCQYGVHYGWGDKISIEFLGYVDVFTIDRVQVSVKSGIESIQLEARGTIV